MLAHCQTWKQWTFPYQTSFITFSSLKTILSVVAHFLFGFTKVLISINPSICPAISMETKAPQAVLVEKKIQFTLFWHKISFVLLLCRENFSQNSCLWRNFDKYHVRVKIVTWLNLDFSSVNTLWQRQHATFGCDQCQKMKSIMLSTHASTFV